MLFLENADWKFGLNIPVRGWFGVIGSKTLTTLLAAVRGKLLIILATSLENVGKNSSVNNP